MSEELQAKAKRAQKRVLDSIPSRWILPANVKAKFSKGDARSIIPASGLLTTAQIDIINHDASDIVQKLAEGKFKAAEVMEAFCASAAVAHQVVNCLVEFFPDEAISQARQLDEQFSETKTLAGPLHGLPMAIKDTHDVKGRTTTWAFATWLDRPAADADSSTVKVMRDAGAIFFARTTMPQTGMALETVSPLWGRTLNPFNPAVFGAGGSSGGDGALVAMRGSPASGLSTDIGGSIRAPAAFNGLYGMRPTAERVPRTGLASPAGGNVSIKVSTGPVCHSMQDLRMFVKLLLTHPTLPYEPTACLPFWDEIAASKSRPKLRIGLMLTDDVVDPHPPVLRALEEVRAKLRAAGHTIVDFRPPFDCWEAALTTWALYFQTGAAETLALLEAGGEKPIPVFAHYLKTFDIKPLAVTELFRHNAAQAGYKAAFQQSWDGDGSYDCIICPSAPLAGSPHDFPLWWGYTTLWNLLDYPSIMMPLKGFKINSQRDPKTAAYSPRSNPFDRANWEIYDPEVWKTQPMTFQIVGRPYHDEALINVSEVIDGVVNATNAPHL
ncbi:hypothetical protein M409DRAFT_71311 [Zasmidium cellare ATCC 36951]|uniref:Amidase domain-containing protein n=1 Tax=Zasmidium cellare ATCC 36951 TaxID=1080233 RepID=A0A6A6BWW2_ZASCE|nr:uncharacterized protein M409DRAFT_71311 [Zasmidium cellare ATCC 36951]KAF2159073.1 hypothetical protein M409DRAFT_71311 [Zasmidium cellare ATCC 36951]